MKFPNCLLWINGKLLYHNQEFDIDQPDNAQDVATIPQGIAGVAVGPAQTVIDITGAVPVAGSDVDLNDFKQAGEPVDVKVQQMGSKKKLVGKFIPRGINVHGSAGSAVMEKNKLTSVGSPAPWFK
jgi:hypothetical protein